MFGNPAFKWTVRQSFHVYIDDGGGSEDDDWQGRTYVCARAFSRSETNSSHFVRCMK